MYSAAPNLVPTNADDSRISSSSSPASCTAMRPTARTRRAKRASRRTARGWSRPSNRSSSSRCVAESVSEARSGTSRPTPVTTTSSASRHGNRDGRRSSADADSTEIAASAPPKPSDTTRQRSIVADRGSTTRSRSGKDARSGSALAAGGITPRSIAARATPSSTAPAAASVCPIRLLSAVTGTRAIEDPSVAESDAYSAASFAGVDVACARTRSGVPTSASRIARAAPRPSGAGCVRWCASLAAPQPSRRPSETAPRASASSLRSSTNAA